MGEYLNHFFFLPPLNQDGIHNPTTPAHHMMRYVLLSHMSRSFGAIARYSFSNLKITRIMKHSFLHTLISYIYS
jgi:hypothetical protein